MDRRRLFQLQFCATATHNGLSNERVYLRADGADGADGESRTIVQNKTILKINEMDSMAGLLFELNVSECVDAMMFLLCRRVTCHMRLK